MIKYYTPGSEIQWDGRVDSETNFNAFRFHQWIEALDLNDEDLEIPESKLSFGIIGFKSHSGIERNKGRTGAAKGPDAIRYSLRNLPCSFSEEVKLYDGGNITVDDDTDLSDGQEQLAKAVERLMSLGVFPIVLGGGHETAYGNYMGQINYLRDTKGDSVNHGIVNFDAHFDFRPYEGKLPNSGTMFRQIYDYNMENYLPYNYMAIGIQKSGNTMELFNFAEKSGTEYLLATEVENWDVLSLLDKVDGYINDKDSIYITICADVFSAPYAPGVSAPQPLGLNPENVIMLMQYIASRDKVVAFDICEVSPRFDQDSTTSSLAAIMIYALVTKMAKVKRLDK